MPSVLLIRHGQASYAGPDYDVLSERGVRQARAAREVLAGVPAARLVCGDLRRQLDTAAAWEAGEELAVDPRWNEYDAGDVLAAHSGAPSSLERPVDQDGRPIDSRDFQALLDRALLGWIEAGADSPAHETWPAFRERVWGALNDLTGSLGSGETGLAFTSGGVIGALAAAALGLGDESMVAFNHVSVNGAFTKLVAGRRGISLISFNEHAHLERDGLVTYR